ncbi:MAG: hypothetical protein WC815_21640 [Vicinamibacterales bacterium]
MPHRRCPALLVMMLAVAGASAGSAQQPAPPPPLKLVLESGEDLGPGRIAVAQGVTAAALARFAVEGLDVAQPVTVVVSSGDIAKPVNVVIVKDNFDEPEQHATTGSDGTATIQLRTHGDFGIGVSAPGGAAVPFMLAVWAGDITPPETQSFLAPVANYDAATLARLKTTAAATDAAPAAAPPAGVSVFAWAGLAVGAVAALGLVFVGVGMLRRKQGGQ